MSDLRVDIASLDSMTNTIQAEAQRVPFAPALAQPHADCFGSSDVVAAVGQAAQTQSAMATALSESVTSIGDAPRAAGAEFAAADRLLASPTRRATF